MELEKFTCEKHGDFEGRAIMCLGLKIEPSCPICQKELDDAEARDLAMREEYDRNGRITLWAETANIPKMYRNQREITPNVNQADALNYNFDKNLILVGSVGTGKTMIASTLGMKAIAQHKTVRYLYASDIATRVKETWGSKVLSEKEAIDDLINCDLLILDEIGRCEYNEWIFKVLDGRYMEQKPTIFLGNIEAKELPRILGDAIASRLRTNVKVITFGETDHRIARSA